MHDERSITPQEIRSLEAIVTANLGQCTHQAADHDIDPHHTRCPACSFMLLHTPGMIWYQRNAKQRLLREEGLPEPPQDLRRLPW